MFDEILLFFTSNFNYVIGYAKPFIELTKENPVLGGVIGLYGAGVLAYFTRYLPGKVLDSVKGFFHKQFTITIKLTNNNSIFYDFIRWYENEGYSQHSRTLKVDERFDGLSQFRIGAGLGNHYFIKNKRIFKLTREERDLNNSLSVKEEMFLTTYGRSRKPFEDLLKLCSPDRKGRVDNLRISTWQLLDWEHSYSQTPRDIKTVILKKEIKDRIIKHIENFHDNKDWYINHGVPYRTGILLKGPGGTGKTSIVKALCSKFNKRLYILNLSKMNDTTFENAMSTIPQDGIVLIEDIDAFNISLNRDDEKKEISLTDPLTMSGILNGIDGIAGSEGRILIATTNHPEKLDKALIRPGRFDLVEEIGYMNDDTFFEMYNNFYPNDKIEKPKIKELITPATVQALVIANLDNPENVLESVCVKNIS